jgi:uncharacterized protein with NRDE domain
VCLIVFAYRYHADYPLIVLGNRDEFYARPTRAAHFWADAPDIFAGRDLQDSHPEQQGTWMGINTSGRFAAVTNFRETGRRELDVNEASAKHSRGELTARFLTSGVALDTYLDTLTATATQYKGYNLLLWEHGKLLHASNRSAGTRQFAPGIYGLSNGVLDAPWPKTVLAKKRLQLALAQPFSTDSLLELLLDDTPAPDDTLPDTGIDRASERLLSSCFIHSEHYGTRASTCMTINKQGEIYFLEQNWLPSFGENKIVVGEQRYLHLLR